VGRLIAPPLSVALVGSTSTGKSTLGNALLGRYLLPCGVQATTHRIINVAQSVTCGHAQIEGRNGWKSWATDTECRDEMKRALSNSAPVVRVKAALATSRYEWWRRHPVVGWRRGFARLGRLTYFSDDFLLVDSPGVAHAGDRAGLEAISEVVRNSTVALLVLSAGETDSQKEAQIVSACFRGLAGKPGRVVVVMNKMDVFDRDEASDATRANILASRQKVVTELAQRAGLGETDVPVVPMIASAAFCAEVMPWSGTTLDAADQAFLRTGVADACRLLIPQDTDALPRRVDDWSASQLKNALCALRRASGLVEILRQLANTAFAPAARGRPASNSSASRWPDER